MKQGKKDSKYNNRLEEIKAVYLDSKDWNKVLKSEVYLNQANTKDVLVDYVEELYKTEVTNPKQLQDLMGTDEDLYDEVEYAFIVRSYLKYFTALKDAVQKGSIYNDLLKITPKNFNLPEVWYGCYTSDQYSTTLRAIGESFYLQNLSLSQLPSLRRISNLIQAPYSVLMNAYEEMNPKIEKFN